MTVKLSDPLKSNILPKSFHTLGLTHHSPTQATLPDGVHLFKYGLLSQQERRSLPANAQMKAGVLVNNVLQNYFADRIWKFGPAGKLQPTENLIKNKIDSEVLVKFDNNRKLDGVMRKKLNLSLASSYGWRSRMNFSKVLDEIIEDFKNSYK